MLNSSDYIYYHNNGHKLREKLGTFDCKGLIVFGEFRIKQLWKANNEGCKKVNETHPRSLWSGSLFSHSPLYAGSIL